MASKSPRSPPVHKRFDRAASLSPPPPLPSSRAQPHTGLNANDRAHSATEDDNSRTSVRITRPRPSPVKRQNTWGGGAYTEETPNEPQNTVPAISVAKTINHLLHIPSNRCCADCRSALVDSSRIHASFRPPALGVETKRLALTRSNYEQTRNFSRTHKAFAPPNLPLLMPENRRSSTSDVTTSKETANKNNLPPDLDRHTLHLSQSISHHPEDESSKTNGTSNHDSPDEERKDDVLLLPELQARKKSEAIDPAILAYRYTGGHGVFLCGQCAQAHKLLGENVTVVRHVQQFQTWSAEEAHAMSQAGGNTMCWKTYEAYLPEHWKRRRPNHASSIEDRLAFCRAKYEAMGFMFPHGGPRCEQAWQRLMGYNLWALENKSRAAELKSIMALSLQLSNKNNPANAMNGVPMTPTPWAELPLRLVDYFCVVGSSGFLDPRILQGEVDLSKLEGPEDVMLEPRVIDCYPPPNQHTDMEFPEHVATFVSPEGCHPSGSQKSPFFFTLVLTTASGHRLYGACLRLYDEAIETQELSEIMEKSNYKGPYPAWLATQQAKSNGSAAPSVDSSEYMDIVYLPKCLVVLSHYPFFDLFRSFLLQLYRITLVEAPLPIERFIANFSCEVPLPPQGKVEVKFGFTVKDIWSVKRPPQNQLPLANFSFKPIFACLSVGNILTLVGCLLTESRIALCSRHYSLLTPISEALLSFLFPLQWQGMYIPIMPFAMVDILDAPVPFLVGLNARYLTQTKPEMRPQGVIFVDVDRDIIHLGYDEDTNNPRVVPPLPERHAMKLRAKVEEHGASIYLPPDNAKLEGNLITNGPGRILPDAKREQYAVTYQPYSSVPQNDRPGASLPGSDEMRRAERSRPRRRAILRAVDRAYQENELLTPITGFLSEQGQLYNRDTIRQVRTQKTGSNLGKIFGLRRLRSSNSLADDEPSNHFSGHFTQSQTNQNQHGIHGLLLDLEEPAGFDSYEIRNSFLRFFVSLLKNYEQFLNGDNQNEPFRIDEFLADLGLPVASQNFVKKMLKTQMFQRFLEERQNDARDPLFLFFDECIIAKQNRSRRLNVRTRETPFLDDASGIIRETFTPPPPSNWGLPDDGRTYQYGSFPKLNRELFGKVRVPMRWKMAKSSSSLRMLQPPPPKATRLQNRSWQHEILTMSMTPTGNAQGHLFWAAKSGIRTLEAAIGALSQATTDATASLSFSSTPAINASTSSRKSLEHSPKGSKSRGGILRENFVKDLSLSTITSAENVLLNARRINGIVLHAICKFQAAVRGFMTRKKYIRFIKALRFLQGKWRRQVPEGLAEMDQLDHARRSISSIQQITKTFLLTRRYRKKRSAAALIQRWYRGAICRKKGSKLERACRQIQKLVKSRRSQIALRLVRSLVARVQAICRGYMTRKHVTSRNKKRLSRYREQIALLWVRVHTPLSYRTKFWPMISHESSFLRLRIAESELERLWIELEVDFNNTALRDRMTDQDPEEIRADQILGIMDFTYFRYLKVKDMLSSVLLFPAEERRNKELILASDRVEAERIQIYERISESSPRMAAMIVTFYDMFKIDAKNKNKKHKLAETIWSGHDFANQSERFMMQVFPELEESSNIIFSPPSKKTLKRFRNVNPSPPRLGRSHWAHTILRDQISMNVREVAINALQGRGGEGQSSHNGRQRGSTMKSLLVVDKAARREIIEEFLAQRKWVGQHAQHMKEPKVSV